MIFIDATIITLYVLGLVVIFFYTLAQGHLAWHYLKSGKKENESTNFWKGKSTEDYPTVTVQLPVYNEKYVITRLIDAVANFQWPTEKLEIQVLDDSTDETIQIIADKVEELREQGIQIQHIRRDSREGYKAGALQYGLQRANGAFTAIFDADFVPNPDFLLQTMPQFENDDIGLVQTCWGHLNEEYSLLTKVQAFALNAHFTVEQAGRNKAGYFMNFNGTAGVWRNACIEHAGGWHHDTLTEDLDLSYRAQLKGWEFSYLEDVISPAELPVTVSALKSQQFRWMKGAAETARKHLSTLWESPLPLIKKIQGTSHLLSSGIFIVILLIAFMSVPLLLVSAAGGGVTFILKFMSFFLSGLVLWILFYSLPLLKEKGKVSEKIIHFIGMFPAFLSISMALSVHNTFAVLKGYAGKTSPFIRTPKFNITGISDSWKKNNYLVTDITLPTIIEGFLAFYFLFGIVAAFIIGDSAMIVFHTMLSAGFGLLFGYSIYEKIVRTA